LNDKKLPNVIEFIRKVDMMDKTFTPKDIIYFWMLDPTVEIGPAQTFPAGVASHACGVLYNVDEFAQAFFSRGAIKSMILTVQGNPPSGEREKLETWWNRTVAGIRNAWGAKVINADNVKPVVIGEGMKELENVTLTQEKKEDVATAFDIPFSILFSNAANYATAVQDKRSWYDDSIVPECEMIAEAMNEQIFAPLKLHFEFLPETLDIMQEDESQRAAALAQLVPSMVDPMFEIAAEVLGYELTDEQWALWRSIQGEKKKQADAMAEQMRQAAQAKPDNENGNQPPDDTTQDGAGQEKPDQSAQTDMQKWQRKALRALQKGQSPAVPFDSDHISEDDRAAMETKLDGLALLATELKRANDLLEHVNGNGSKEAANG
jgi:hypothetical protein